jgi:hypothetical protein
MDQVNEAHLFGAPLLFVIYFCLAAVHHYAVLACAFGGVQGFVGEFD